MPPLGCSEEVFTCLWLTAERPPFLFLDSLKREKVHPTGWAAQLSHIPEAEVWGLRGGPGPRSRRHMCGRRLLGCCESVLISTWLPCF